MSGKRVFNWREGDRNEYLADFLLSALGLVNPVPRQEDVGVDFYCSLADQEKGVVTFGFPYLVHLRSVAKPVVHIKPPKRYRHQRRTIPDHLSWLFRQDLPLFLGLLDREYFSIQLYSLSSLWFLYYDDETCPDCSALRLVPRTDGTETGPVGPPKQTGKVTSSPESFEYQVDLGLPVASFSVRDTGNRQILTAQKNSLRHCIDHELRNLVSLRAALPHFHWIKETGEEGALPTVASYSREAPREAEQLKQVYSFLGPSLISLALRYKADDRADLLRALQPLFLEMPDDTFPPDIQKALPEIFAKKRG